MKKNIFQILYMTGFVLISFAFQNCKHRTEPVPPPSNPCDTAKVPTADFKIYEAVDTDYMLDELVPYWQKIDTDTLLTDGAIFESNEYGAKYKWRLGAETLTSRRFYREDYPFNALINVSLELTKKHPLRDRCFPTTDTIFTKYKTFKSRKGQWRENKVLGRYSGKFMHKANETKVLEMGSVAIDCPISAPSTQVCESFRIIGLDGTCNSFFDHDRGSNFVICTKKQIYFNFGQIDILPGCQNTEGIFRVHGVNDDSLTVIYKIYQGVTTNVPTLTFKGKRIQ